MLRIFIIGFIFLIFPLTTSAYSLITKTVDGHRVRIFHIPSDDAYRVTAVASNSGSSLKSLIASAGGVAGINGAYFMPRDYSGLPDTTNAVRIMGHDGFSYSKYFPDTGVNGVFGFLADGSPLLVQNNIYNDTRLRDNFHSGMLLELESGIANFPILLANSKNLLPRYQDAGLITEKMRTKTTKSFICRTPDSIKMGTIEKISMLDVPDFLGKFGCIDAINLDNGGSMALYDRQKYVVGPGRNIMDAFVIIRK